MTMTMRGRRPLVAVTGVTVTGMTDTGLLLLMMMTMTTVMMTGVRADIDDPLFLTPFIKNGSVNEARRLSRVHAYFTGTVKSHAGFVTVNDTYDSNLFIWFFPSKNESAPLVLWLNGGPGHPSTMGAMLENGPLALTKDNKGEPVVTWREIHWANHFHMLYIDSPVGTGYSFTRNPAGEARVMSDITPTLYTALTQFYQMFSEYQTNDLYIGGQSYAGKYIPSLGKFIHDRNAQSPQIHMPLKGVYIGAGLCDPERMFPEFPEALYHAGLISNKFRHDLGHAIRGMIDRSLASGITTVEDINLVILATANCSENGDVSNIMGLKAMVSQYDSALSNFMNHPKTRQALHAGNKGDTGLYEFLNNTVFYDFIERDLFVNTNAENVFLMENYKVLHYTGNLDQVVGVGMTEPFLESLQWSGQAWYRQHYNTQWWNHAQTQLMGWYASYGNFTRVIVRNAGHHVPHSQPQAALDMMVNFIHNQPFVGKPSIH